METIDLTPTREGYINMLKLLIENSTNAEDVVWAKEELTKLETLTGIYALDNEEGEKK